MGFEPTLSAGERPQTYALDRAATGTGYDLLLKHVNETVGLTESVDGLFRFLFDQADMHKIFCITKSNLSKSYPHERSGTSEIYSHVKLCVL